MHNKILGAIGAGMLLASMASAQAMPQANKDAAGNPALKHMDVKMTKAPAQGANSFTEAQARSRISMAGYSHVSDLKKDNDGLWQGKAMKNGKPLRIALDYKGDVSTK
jgi:hypothetical protein